MSVKGIPLAGLDVGQGGRILSLNGGSPDRIGKLMALGLYPGTPIRVLQKFPSYVLQVGHTQLAVDAETAQGIEVVQEAGRGAACRHRHRHRGGFWWRWLNG